MAELGVISDLRLYRRLVGAKVRSEWQYRTSFVTFLIGQATINGLEFVTILLLFEVVPDLGGWDRYEVGLLYGLATVPFALGDIFVSPIERLGVHVRAGTFDRLLLRPASAMLQMCAGEFELRRIGKLIPTVTVLVWAMQGVSIDWTLGRVLALAVGIIAGAITYSSLWVLTSSLSFWIISAQEATNALTYGGQHANQYPLHMYREWIRALMGWALPLAFIAYVPAIYVLGAPNPLGVPQWFIFLSLPVALLMAAFAFGVWTLGVRHYQGTGS